MQIALAMSEEQLLSKVTLGTRREPGMCKQLGLGWIHHRRWEMANPGWPDLVIKAPAGRRRRDVPRAKEAAGTSDAGAAGVAGRPHGGRDDAAVRRPCDYLSGLVARELAALAGMGSR